MGGRIPSFGALRGGPPPHSSDCCRLPPTPFLITSTLLNWAKGARARVCQRGGSLLTHGAPGGGGCWLPAQERAPSPSPSRWRIVSSNRWTEPEGRGRADGVRDGSALAGPSGALTKAGAGRRGAPYQRWQTAGSGGRPQPAIGLTKARAGRWGGGWKINCPIKLSARGGGGTAAPGDAGRRIMKCAKS